MRRNRVSIGECMRRAGFAYGGDHTTAEMGAVDIELEETRKRLALARRLNAHLMARNRALEERLEDDLK